MISRLVSGERFVTAQTAPRWLVPLAFAIALAAAALYGVLEVAQAPGIVEAPGFLTPMDDGQMQIAAYVPLMHPEYAMSGARARVIFPDGSERTAAIAPVDEGAPPLPHQEMLGDDQLGTLVRMEFVDASSAARMPMVEGLPVKLHFEASPKR